MRSSIFACKVLLVYNKAHKAIKSLFICKKHSPSKMRVLGVHRAGNKLAVYGTKLFSLFTEVQDLRWTNKGANNENTVNTFFYVYLLDQRQSNS